MKSKSLLLGILTGASIIGLSTLLSTPSSGKDLRRNIEKSKKELQESVLEIIAKLKDFGIEISSATTLSKDTITITIAEIQNSIQTWKKDIEPHTIKMKHCINELEHALTELAQAEKAEKT